MNEDKEKKRAAAAALFLFRFRPRVTGHVGALHPASPCSTGGLRQQCALKSAGRPFMLAPCTPQALVPSSDRANPGAALWFGSRTPAGKANEFGLRARTLERKEAEKQPALRFGSRTPAGKANEFGFRARTTGHVGVAFPSTPYSAVGLRQPRRRFRTCSRIV